jgi:hypothetical protein
VHASWLDQCEIYCSIVHRKVVNPSDLESTEEIAERLCAFEEHYNAVAAVLLDLRARRPRQAVRPAGATPPCVDAVA